MAPDPKATAAAIQKRSRRRLRPKPKPKAPTRPPGRPFGTPEKLTPQVQKDICDSLELAVPIKYAAESVGISEDTVYHWMRLGRSALADVAAGKKPDLAAGIYVEFLQAVTRARAQAVKNLTAKALAGGKGSLAAPWFLERRFREEYGPVNKLVVSPDDDIAPDELTRRVEAYRSAIMAGALPTRPDGVDDRSAGAEEAGAGAASSGPPPSP